MKSRFREIEAKLPILARDAINDGAQRIADRAKAAAPVRTGRLKESIDTRAAPEQATGRAAGGYRRDVVAEWYWFLQEFGTVNQAARPFMIPAAEAERASIVADVERRLRNL